MPAGRAPGTLDALWGDAPPRGLDSSQAVFSTAARREAEEGRDGLAGKLFNSLAASAPAEQNAISDYFNAETVREAHKPHSLLLRHHKDKYASDETLTDQVKRVVGHL
jgi:hypothetical protein